MGSSDESGSSSSSSETEKKVTKKTVKKVTKKEPKVAKGKGKKEGKKEKKKKDENAPRRYLSPFIFFSKDHRPTIKAQNPQSTFGEIGSLLGREWGKITPEEKKKYEKMAAEDKKRWELEKKVYDEKSKAAPAESSSDSSDESD